MVVVMKLPTGLTKADVPALKEAVEIWAESRLSAPGKKRTCLVHLPRMNRKRAAGKMIGTEKRNTGVAALARKLGYSVPHVSLVVSGQRKPTKRLADELRRMGYQPPAVENGKKKEGKE